jgi:hypothetical protein
MVEWIKEDRKAGWLASLKDFQDSVKKKDVMTLVRLTYLLHYKVHQFTMEALLRWPKLTGETEAQLNAPNRFSQQIERLYTSFHHSQRVAKVLAKENIPNPNACASLICYSIASTILSHLDGSVEGTDQSFAVHAAKVLLPYVVSGNTKKMFHACLGIRRRMTTSMNGGRTKPHTIAKDMRKGIALLAHNQMKSPAEILFKRPIYFRPVPSNLNVSAKKSIADNVLGFIAQGEMVLVDDLRKDFNVARKTFIKWIAGADFGEPEKSAYQIPDVSAKKRKQCLYDIGLLHEQVEKLRKTGEIAELGQVLILTPSGFTRSHLLHVHHIKDLGLAGNFVESHEVNVFSNFALVDRITHQRIHADKKSPKSAMRTMQPTKSHQPELVEVGRVIPMNRLPDGVVEETITAKLRPLRA